MTEQEKAFGFVNKDAEELYKAVLILLDSEFQNALVRVMNPEIKDSERAYESGRVSAYNDALRLFQANREYATSFRTGETQSKPSQ